VLAVLKSLERLIEAGIDAEHNRTRANQIRQTYVGYLDPVTLVSRTKLTLNRNNDSYYQTYLVPLGHLPQRGFRASEHSLRKAFEWFDRHVRERTDNEADKGRALATLIETLSDRLFFTVITVTDELNAYKVFETLNARGVRLSATDLLKNYLFSVLHRSDQHEHEMRLLEDRWESMVGRLGSESFPDFLRVHWNSRHAFVRQTELFKTIRSQVRERENVFDLIRQMEEDIDTYLGLTSPDPAGWNPGLKEHATHLRMFNVRQPFSLLLAARRILSEPDFEIVLRAAVVISFRYNVIGSLPTSEQERVYNHVASRIVSKQFLSAREVLQGLTSIYPNDSSFKAAFTEKVIRTTQSRNRSVVRYILCELEKQYSGKEFALEGDSLSIEHIMPQHPETGWESFSEEEIESLTYRLGNLTLLQVGTNRELGNSDFAAKREVYAKSVFGLTQKVAADNESWTADRLSNRQRWMAAQATGIWRVPQLSA
jgi:hypothetical protein